MPKPPEDGFETLIAPQLAGLYRSAYRLTGHAADAEDLVQDVCVSACQCLVTLASADHPDRWLYRALYNRFVDVTRRRRRSPVLPLEDCDAAQARPGSEPGPEELAEQNDRERAFDHAWRQLEETQRALLALRAEGYGLAEIEEITGIGADVLRARLHRARKSLARQLALGASGDDNLPRLGRSR